MHLPPARHHECDPLIRDVRLKTQSLNVDTRQHSTAHISQLHNDARNRYSINVAPIAR